MDPRVQYAYLSVPQFEKRLTEHPVGYIPSEPWSGMDYRMSWVQMHYRQKVCSSGQPGGLEELCFLHSILVLIGLQTLGRGKA